MPPVQYSTVQYFDCLEHEILLQKLEKYNLGSDAIAWLRDFLLLRTQYVVIGGGQSRMTPVTTGVPQGSVLGPLLYAIFVNETSEAIKQVDCTDQTHLDRSKLFGRQCQVCGLLTGYADDNTYTIASRTRLENQTKIIQALDQSERLPDGQ